MRDPQFFIAFLTEQIHPAVMVWFAFAGHLLYDNLRKNFTEVVTLNKEMKKIRWLTQGAAIAALYVVLTLVFAPISFGPMQVRISEILTILPLFTPAAIPGLFIGCVIGNIAGGAIILDVIFGSIATLIGAAAGYLLRFNRWLVPIPTIIANALIVPFVLKYGYGIDLPLYLMAIYVAIGEVIGCFVLGELFASVLLKRKGVFKLEK